VDNSEDDTHLHLVRVGEDESVVGSMPGGVESEGVGSMLNRGDGSVGVRPFPSGLEESHRLGEDIVVDESGEHREDSHEKDDVSTAARREGKDGSRSQLLFLRDPRPSFSPSSPLLSPI